MIKLNSRLNPIYLTVGGCNFDKGGFCDWTQSTAADLKYYLGATDVYSNYDTGPPHEHTNSEAIPDKDCRIWKKGGVYSNCTM